MITRARSNTMSETTEFDEAVATQEMKEALEEGELPKKKKRKRTNKQNKPREVRSSKGNRWIDFYMAWRKENKDTVDSISDVKVLVKLARKEYTPLSKNVFCEKCGHENKPPFKRNP